MTKGLPDRAGRAVMSLISTSLPSPHSSSMLRRSRTVAGAASVDSTTSLPARSSRSITSGQHGSENGIRLPHTTSPTCTRSTGASSAMRR